MMLLLFWLNKFIIPNPEGFIQHEYVYLAEDLHNDDDVATGLFILASLFHCLHQITTKLMDLNVYGPLWMIQIWLQWYFPEHSLGNLDFPNYELLALTIISSPIKSVKAEECFVFFCDCK